MKKRCFYCFQYYEDSEETNQMCPHCHFQKQNSKRKENHLPNGTILTNQSGNQFTIGEVVGDGGFGVTYKAWDEHLQMIVAVKEYFHTEVINRAPGQKNVVLVNQKKKKIYQKEMNDYLREARIVSQFSSQENIVTVLDFFEENETAYIVMEFLDGQTVREILKQKGRMSVKEVLHITLSICQALKTMHQENFLHRDIAPDNICICQNGTVKLFDFGASRMIETDKQLTAILKPNYAPPEQYRNSMIQQRYCTDIYALGATMYRMVTGKVPMQSLYRQKEDIMPEPIVYNSELPEYLNTIIMKAMALEPEYRFQSAEELENAIRQELPVKKESEILLRKKRNYSFLRVFVIIILLLCIVLCWVAIQKWKANRIIPAQIEVWYVENSERSAAFEKIRKEFCENHSTIEINFISYPEEIYEEKLTKAQESGTLPALFQSDNISTEDYAIQSIESILSDVVTENCLFLQKNQKNLLQSRKLPLGFQVPVLYMNTTRCEMIDFSEFSEKSNTYQCITVKNQELWNKLFPNISYQADTEEIFLRGQADILFSDTSDFFLVQKSLPAQSVMLALETQTIFCTFCDEWSLGNTGNSAETSAAEQFLIFLLNDYAQDLLYIQNQSGTLPLNEQTLTKFNHVYEQFDTVLANTEKFTFFFDDS